MELKEGLRKVFLAGVGAISTTGEKGAKLIDDLVKKGELTVDEGKILNSDLAKKVSSGAADLKSKGADLGKSFRDLLYNVDKMSREERDELAAKIEAANKAEDEKAKADGKTFVDEAIDSAIADTTQDAPTIDPASAAIDAVSKDAEEIEDPATEQDKAEAKEFVNETISAATQDDTDNSDSTVDPASAAFDAVAKSSEKE